MENTDLIAASLYSLLNEGNNESSWDIVCSFLIRHGYGTREELWRLNPFGKRSEVEIKND